MPVTLSQASVHLRHIIPPDFETLNSAPRLNSQPVPISIESEDVERSLPVVDLESPTAEESLVRACESWGMFLITNHGIPSSVLGGVEAEASRFFSLPRKEKMKTLRVPGGTAGYGMAPIAAILDEVMWHEGFTITGSPIEHANRVWPRDYMKFCEIMEEYQKRMKALSERILTLVLKSTGGLPVFHESGPSTALQLNSYPACRHPNEMIGLAPHTDTSFITIIHQNDVNGLQLFRQGHGWVSAAPKTGLLMVNVGDMLYIMSNARFRNALHRAVVSPTGHRLSIAYFFGPPADFKVSPVINASATGSCQAARFRPVTKREYVRMKARNLNALSLIGLHDKENKLIRLHRKS